MTLRDVAERVLAALESEDELRHAWAEEHDGLAGLDEADASRGPVRPMTGERERDLIAKPKRIQRQRTKGWRMPEGAVYVGRPSRWGNPWTIGHMSPWTDQPIDAAEAVRLYRYGMDMRPGRHAAQLLRGHDLACWCPLDQPCHADVLLELANA